MKNEPPPEQRTRCIEDYRYIGEDAGGSAYTYCDRCPLLNLKKEDKLA